MQARCPRDREFVKQWLNEGEPRKDEGRQAVDERNWERKMQPGRKEGGKS